MRQFKELGQEMSSEQVEGSSPLGISCATAKAYVISPF